MRHGTTEMELRAPRSSPPLYREESSRKQESGPCPHEESITLKAWKHTGRVREEPELEADDQTLTPGREVATLLGLHGTGKENLSKPEPVQQTRPPLAAEKSQPQHHPNPEECCIRQQVSNTPNTLACDRACERPNHLPRREE